MNRTVVSGLYVIADTGLLPAGALAPAVAAAIAGGARLVQYRNKAVIDGARQAELIALRQLCRAAAVPLIINDDIALAREVGADGVHLGRDDAAIARARSLLGQGLLIGASCYNELRLALGAQQAGADYVAFGSFFASPTKPDAVTAHPSLLRQARAQLPLPIVAIGGITPDNGAALIDAGADALAVISGVFGQADPTAAARRYAGLWERDAAATTSTGDHDDAVT